MRYRRSLPPRTASAIAVGKIGPTLSALALGYVALPSAPAAFPAPSVGPAEALPSFARQTGQPCATCHTAFPELTPYGREFKLRGFTAGGTRCGDVAAEDAEMQIPIAGMTTPGFTHLQKGIPDNNNSTIGSVSAFFGGQIYCNLGAFIQGTYDRSSQTGFLDNTDLRYANTTKVRGI